MHIFCSNSLQNLASSELQLAVLRLPVQKIHVHAAVRYVYPVERTVRGILLHIPREYTVAPHLIGEAVRSKQWRSLQKQLLAMPYIVSASHATLKEEQIVFRGSIPLHVVCCRRAIRTHRCCCRSKDWSRRMSNIDEIRSYKAKFFKSGDSGEVLRKGDWTFSPVWESVLFWSKTCPHLCRCVTFLRSIWCLQLTLNRPMIPTNQTKQAIGAIASTVSRGNSTRQPNNDCFKYFHELLTRLVTNCSFYRLYYCTVLSRQALSNKLISSTGSNWLAYLSVAHASSIAKRRRSTLYGTETPEMLL